MTPTQCVTLIRAIRTMCPAQKIDDYTPDVWYAAGLKDMDFLDALDVVNRLGTRQPFIALCDVCEGVREVREYRLLITPNPPPDADPDDSQAYIDELRRQRERRMARPDQPKELA